MDTSAGANESNPLVSNTRASDTSPLIQLHPLVLLTISDHITRHTLRGQEGPIVGAILGQQNGREITMEVAFECGTVVVDGHIHLDQAKFQDRLEQFKEVHKAPQLDLVGWFTVGSPSGPKPAHLPIHTAIQKDFGFESAVLLIFHDEPTAKGGKLPLTLYESIWTNDSAAMEVDNAHLNQNSMLQFRELTYSVETGEAEMISVDFVARGGGNATAIQGPAPVPSGAADKKGKSKEAPPKGTQVNGAGSNSYLSPEDEEQLTSMTAKRNALKMLHQRIALLHTYLKTLPPSYLTDPDLSPTATADQPLNHQVLRSISALLSRLPLLVPSDKTAFERELMEEKADVELIGLLSSITNSVQEAKELGRKHAIVESSKMSERRKMSAHGGGGDIGGFSGAGGADIMNNASTDLASFQDDEKRMFGKELNT
ncbi:hypothetical protein K402DRAFT_407181 [Aulographum hederae CBS 113979]|uniref:COP9 signalosome complex subunit 6 n=1 Tax=Aulographum hederae CBS 113979 TaxID=1176131 RepID=A0A6G1GQL4_9PEZI|nr:hypothetical protein K402DRAFT_407181 [Aulographum hederae CBS 113979]